MSFSALFVKRRIFAYMLSATIILFGLIGLKGIGIDRLPNIDAPIVTVTTLDPGSSSDVMDSSITKVIESAVNTVSDIEYIESKSSPSVSEIRVWFHLHKDPDAAFNEIQTKVNQVLSDLPRSAKIPVVAKLDPGAIPVVWIVLKGDRTLHQLNQIARLQVKRGLETIRGVGEVTVGGGRERKIRIDLDLKRMSALGIVTGQVIAAFGREHIQVPGGYLVDSQLEKLLHLDLEYHSVKELENLVVNWRDQIPIRLGDIAMVRDGLSENRSMASYKGEQAVAIGVLKVQNANTVMIVSDIIEHTEQHIKPNLPSGVELTIVTNEAEIIGNTISALENHIVEGVVLAAIVVWLFLMNIPATLIIATAIPVSLLGAIIVMYFGGFTFNIMTLSGLLLLIGVVVDDAIVVLESVQRQFESGIEDPDTAAIQGTAAVVFPVIASTLTLVCIFSTVIFMQGMAGVFLRSFAVVVTVGVLASMFVSLSLTPALCASFLRRAQINPQSERWLVKYHRTIEKTYSEVLILCLKNKAVIVLAASVIVLGTGFFFSQLGTEFLPEDDESRFLVVVKTPLGSSIDYTKKKVDEVEALIKQYPEVRHQFTTLGSRRSDDVTRATIRVALAPKDQRSKSQGAIMKSIRATLAEVADVDIYISYFPFISGMKSQTLEINLTGQNLYEVARLAEELKTRMQQHGGMGDIELNLRLNRPMLTFDIDRNRANAVGLSTKEIGDTLRVVAGGADIAKYSDLTGDRERYDIRLQADQNRVNNASDLEEINLMGSDGGLIRLGSLVTINEGYGPAVIERRNLGYSAGLYSTPELSLGEATAAVRALAEELLPVGYSIELGGQALELEKTVYYVIFVFITGAIMIYMVLASQFNSFLQPVLVMLAQPLAIIGGVVSLWIAGHTLNIYSMIGLVLLIGLVSKNSILLIDLINRYREEGMETNAAIIKACPIRLRPVLMTSLTVILAMLPAAIGSGAGSGQYGPLAVAVLGGVISSTLLTLVVVPVAYSLLGRWLVIQPKSNWSQK